MGTDFKVMSDTELAAEITTWAGRIAAGEAHLLALIGEYDDRAAWSGPGMLSCAHWLSWRLGMGLVAARERVRVARLLRELPLTAAAFEAGQVSWTQVRALTRCATLETEEQLLGLARSCTGAQIERVARGLARVAAQQEDSADPFVAEQRMRSRVRYDDDGTMVLTLRVPAAQAPVVKAGLERVMAEVQAERDLAAERLSAELAVGLLIAADDASAEAPGAAHVRSVAEWKAGLTLQASVLAQARHDQVEIRKATLGDALVRLAARALDASSPVPIPKDRLVLHVDPLSGWARTADGELLPPGLLPRPRTAVAPALAGQQLLPAVVGPELDDRTAHDRGRTSRDVNGRLRRALGVIDGERCRFPGCPRNTNLHAHHVVYWSAGGPTDLANLVLVCSRHHTLIHAEGFQLVLDPDRTLTVRTKGDIPVPHHPPPVWGEATLLDPTHDIDENRLPPQWHGEPLDLSYVTMVLLQHSG